MPPTRALPASLAVSPARVRSLSGRRRSLDARRRYDIVRRAPTLAAVQVRLLFYHVNYEKYEAISTSLPRKERRDCEWRVKTAETSLNLDYLKVMQTSTISIT